MNSRIKIAVILAFAAAASGNLPKILFEMQKSTTSTYSGFESE